MVENCIEYTVYSTCQKPKIKAQEYSQQNQICCTQVTFSPILSIKKKILMPMTNVIITIGFLNVPTWAPPFQWD